MRPDEQYTHNDLQPPRRGKDFTLVYYEQVGSKSYLRLTRLAVILIIGLTVFSVVAILVIFLVADQRQRNSLQDVNANVPLKTSTPYSPSKPIIQQPTPQPPP